MTDLDVTLPAQLLWAAAQCASTDEYRGALHTVQVEFKWNDSESVHATIRATNGHIGYRVATIAKGSCDALSSSESEPVRVLILAKTLGKILKTEKTISVSRLAGETRVQGFKMGIRPDAEYVGGASYPDLDHVWPDINSMECNPGGPVGFGGGYLEIMGKVAQRVDVSCLRLFTSTPKTPTVWQTDETESLDHPAFLVMPVLLRA